MKSLNEKELIRLKVAICLNNFLEENGARNIELDKQAFKKKFADGLRQLEASSGISYNVLQTASMGKRDLQITTVIRILEALDIKPAAFFKSYDSLTEKDIELGRKLIDSRAKPRTKKI